jgi:hypothetical protein
LSILVIFNSDGKFGNDGGGMVLTQLCKNRGNYILWTGIRISWVGVGGYYEGGGSRNWGGAVWGTIEFPVPWATPGSNKGYFQ